MKYILSERLEEITELSSGEGSPVTGNPSYVCVVTSKEAQETMKSVGMEYEGDLSLQKVSFCKIEPQQECLAGSLSIPRLADVMGSRYKILFFINNNNIVIIDDDRFSLKMISRICRKKTNQGISKERFLYNFILEFISRDLEVLSAYEKKLMDLEEDILRGKLEEFSQIYFPIRKELILLRSYYDEIMDMGKELEANENGFFRKKHLKYFGTVTDRADRLMNRTSQLLEYAQQVKDAYQSSVDAQQNKNMQFLTVISAIFFPLTLITGWYGMNFQNMPELANGYPGVILLSLCVIGICILVFKKKKML